MQLIGSEKHTHTFNGPLSGTTQVSQYQKGKTNLDFTEAKDSGWQWHQLGHNASRHLAPDRQPHQHPTTHVFTGRMPFLPPNQQRQSTEGKQRYRDTDTLTAILRSITGSEITRSNPPVLLSKLAFTLRLMAAGEMLIADGRAQRWRHYGRKPGGEPRGGSVVWRHHRGLRLFVGVVEFAGRLNGPRPPRAVDVMMVQTVRPLCRQLRSVAAAVLLEQRPTSVSATDGFTNAQFTSPAGQDKTVLFVSYQAVWIESARQVCVRVRVHRPPPQSPDTTKQSCLCRRPA